MASNGRRAELSRRQRRFIAALLAAPTVEEAASSAGIGERTAYRYLGDPSVKRALSQALDGALSLATRQTVNAMTKALDTLETIHVDDEAPASARVSAARAILDTGLRLREVLDIAERLTELEERLEETEVG